MKIPFLSKKKSAKVSKASKKSVKASAKKSGKSRVIVYSTKTCPWCAKTKEFLKVNKVSFTTKDVGSSTKNAQEMFKKSGQQGVPVTEINGKIIIGFNEGKLKSALKA
jgi:glutaredoxin-like YruB-family protein|tara:strand:- start:249 stop:572 length:324 start_codon:yes stop_codon:yes gene_type:complete